MSNLDYFYFILTFIICYSSTYIIDYVFTFINNTKKDNDTFEKRWLDSE